MASSAPEAQAQPQPQPLRIILKLDPAAINFLPHFDLSCFTPIRRSRGTLVPLPASYVAAQAVACRVLKLDSHWAPVLALAPLDSQISSWQDWERLLRDNDTVQIKLQAEKVDALIHSYFTARVHNGFARATIQRILHARIEAMTHQPHTWPTCEVPGCTDLLHRTPLCGSPGCNEGAVLMNPCRGCAERQVRPLYYCTTACYSRWLTEHCQEYHGR